MLRSRYPSLQIPTDLAPDLRTFLEGVKERLEITTGDRGDPRDRLLTVRDVEAAGMANVTVRNKFATLSGGATVEGIQSLLAENVDGGDFAGLSIPTLESLDPASLNEDTDFIVYDRSATRVQRASYETLRALFLTPSSDTDIVGNWVFTNEDLALEISGTAPRLRFTETADFGETLDADNNIWDWYLDAGLMQLNLVSDDEVTSVALLEIGRDGMDPQFLALMNGAILQIQDGILAAPGLAFDEQITTGLYRISSGRIGVSANGVLALDITGAATLYPDGTAAAPSIAIQSDPNTGVFSLGSDILGVAAGGVERLRVNTNGVRVTGATVVFTATGHIDTTPTVAADYAVLKIRNSAVTEVWRLNSETDGDLDFARQSGTGLLRLNGVALIDAALFTTGTLADARLSANVPLKNTANTFALTNTFTLTPVVPNSSWTYAKIQDVSATARVLGRVTAGAGVIEELTGAQVAMLITYTAADVLAKLLTVDGPGSLLDADFLDGLSSADFALLAHTHAATDIVSGTLNAARVAGTWPDATELVLGNLPDLRLYHDGTNSFIRNDTGHLFAALATGTTPVNLDATASLTVVAPRFTFAALDASNFDFISYPTSYTSPTAPASGATLGSFRFRGHDSTALRTVARMTAVAAQTWTAGSAYGTTLNFANTATGATAAVVRLSLANDQVQVTDGTSLLPGLAFITDIDTGMFRAAANTIGFSVNALEVLRIDSNGLGISSSVPSFRLNETDASADEGVWRTDVNSRIYRIRAFNDALTLSAAALAITRGTGATPSITNIAYGNATDNPTQSFLGTGTSTFSGQVTALRFVPTSATVPTNGLYLPATNTVGLASNTTLGFAVDATQRIYGTALHNNASSPTGTTNQYVASGTYTPTLTNATNVAASTAFQCQWMRVGNVVTVSGRVSVDPTAAGATILGISLPLASNIGAVEDCAGTAFANAVAGQGAAIWGDATNDRASMEWVAVDITNQGMSFTFTYEII